MDDDVYIPLLPGYLHHAKENILYRTEYSPKIACILKFSSYNLFGGTAELYYSGYHLTKRVLNDL